MYDHDALLPVRVNVLIRQRDRNDAHGPLALSSWLLHDHLAFFHATKTDNPLVIPRRTKDVYCLHCSLTAEEKCPR